MARHHPHHHHSPWQECFLTNLHPTPPLPPPTPPPSSLFHHQRRMTLGNTQDSLRHAAQSSPFFHVLHLAGVEAGTSNAFRAQPDDTGISLNLFFFHFPTRRFFGKTWHHELSPPKGVAAGDQRATTSSAFRIDESLLFHYSRKPSSFASAASVGVPESRSTRGSGLFGDMLIVGELVLHPPTYHRRTSQAASSSQPMQNPLPVVASSPSALGWFHIAVEPLNTAVTDYSQVQHFLTSAPSSSTSPMGGAGLAHRRKSMLNWPVLFARVPIYRGSCAVLLHVLTLAEVDTRIPKLEGAVVHALLQTHQALSHEVAGYMPEYYLVSLSVADENDDEEGIDEAAKQPVAGLRVYKREDGSGIDRGGEIELDPQTYTAILDNLTLSLPSFYASANNNWNPVSRWEVWLLDLLRRDYCYYLNLPPSDPATPQLTVMERRLRVGLHNGLRYVDEPNCLYLKSTTQSATGSLSPLASRRRSRSASKMEEPPPAAEATMNVPSAADRLDYLTAKNCVRLATLVGDERMAVVFALDFLVGFAKSDGSILESRRVLIAWNAWSPYRHGSFTLNDTITLPLVGSVGPNPDQELCMRSTDMHHQLETLPHQQHSRGRVVATRQPELPANDKALSLLTGKKATGTLGPDEHLLRLVGERNPLQLHFNFAMVDRGGVGGGEGGRILTGASAAAMAAERASMAVPPGRAYAPSRTTSLPATPLPRPDVTTGQVGVGIDDGDDPDVEFVSPPQSLLSPAETAAKPKEPRKKEPRRNEASNEDKAAGEILLPVSTNPPPLASGAASLPTPRRGPYEYEDEHSSKYRVVRASRQATLLLSTQPFPPLLREDEAPTRRNQGEAMAQGGLEEPTTEGKTIARELADPLQVNEVRIQFLAIAATHTAENLFYCPTPALSQHHYFLSTRFYRCQPVSTERLAASNSSASTIEQTGLRIFSTCRDIEASNAMQQQQHSDNVQNENGAVLKFRIDPTQHPYSTESATEDFVKYLFRSQLCIDVWEADSLIHIGSVALPLAALCRHNSPATQSAILQCPVVKELPQYNGLALASSGSVSIVTAMLFLRMANVGHMAPKRALAVLQQRSKRQRLLCSKMATINNGVSIHQQRAQPLGLIHESALQRYLSAQQMDIVQRSEELFSDANAQRLQQWNQLKRRLEEREMTNASGVVNAQRVKRYIFDEELEAYRLLRQESKAAKLLKAVFRGITATHRIHANYGQSEFFEFLLQNTFAEQVICQIDMPEGCGIPNTPATTIATNAPAPHLYQSNSPLQLLTDTEEWHHWKSVHNLKTPLERDLIHLDDESGQPTMLLRAMESVYIPFKYDPFHLLDGDGGSRWSAEGEMEEASHEEKVVFRRRDTGEPIAVLELLVTVGRFAAVERSFRWLADEQSKVERSIPIVSLGGCSPSAPPILSARCTDPSIAIALRHESRSGATTKGYYHQQQQVARGGAHQSLALKLHVGPPASHLRTFHVLLYSDRYCCQLVAVWHFTLHSMLRITVDALHGQATRLRLPMGDLLQHLRATITHGGGQPLLQFHASSTRDVEIHPQQPFSPFTPSSNTGANSSLVLDEAVQILLRPTFVGSALFQLTAVAVGSYAGTALVPRLLSAWLVAVRAKETAIARNYEVALSRNQATNNLPRGYLGWRIIAFDNPYPSRRTFHAYSSNPELLAINCLAGEGEAVESELVKDRQRRTDCYFSLEGGESTSLRLSFFSPMLPGGASEKMRNAAILLFFDDGDSGQQEEVYEFRVSYESGSL